MGVGSMTGPAPRSLPAQYWLSQEVYRRNYCQPGDGDIAGTWRRVAMAAASREADAAAWAERFSWTLDSFKFIPGGRILSNAGAPGDQCTCCNCFVDGFSGHDQDSIDGIMAALTRQIKILRSEGGYGFCADVMRPAGAFVSGNRSLSCGPVGFLELWETASAVIDCGIRASDLNSAGPEKSVKSVRKGAQMVTLSCWHPDIEDFITAKTHFGRLQRFNMSVLATDDFMAAVENDQPWHYEFPDFEAAPAAYAAQWDGDIVAWRRSGLPVRRHTTLPTARLLWDRLMSATYTKNEPGILFVDRINALNNLNYCERISATNPCGEQILPNGGVCVLGSLELTRFIDAEANDWNYPLLEQMVPIAVRLLDNIIDLTHVPLPIHRENLMQKRRIGLGYLGYASALMLMKVRYGTERALWLADRLGRCVSNAAYRASAELAREKGSFPLFDAGRYADQPFIRSLADDTRAAIARWGLRNSHILSIQPTGNTSILAGNVSSGIEPVFRKSYTRTVRFMALTPEDLQEHAAAIQTDLGSAPFGSSSPASGGCSLVRECEISDRAIALLMEADEWDDAASWAACAMDIGIDAHLKTLETFARHVDSAISKTVNVPQHCAFDDFKDLYLTAYRSGVIKGCTTYRAGTMPAVLKAVVDADETPVIARSDAGSVAAQAEFCTLRSAANECGCD